MKHLFKLIFLFNISFVSAQTIDLNNGLIMYLPFCGDAVDASGNNNLINVQGATLTNDRFGNPNAAYLFDGINDFISITHGEGMKPTYPFSFSCWIKLLADNGGVNLIFANDYLSPGTSYYGVYFNVVSSRLTANVGDGGIPNPASRRSKIANTNIPLNSWIHLAAVVNSASNMSLYYGSNEIAGQYTGSGTGLTYSENNSGVMGVGNGGFGQNYLNAEVDEIRFYNRALNINEIAALANYINSPENLLIESSQSVICPNGSIQLYASSENHTQFNWSNGEVTDSISISFPGEYTLQAIDNCGAIVRDTIFVNSGSCLQKMNLGDDRFICEGNSIQVNGTVLGAQEYLWNDDVTQPIREISTNGEYSLIAQNECYIEYDTINVFNLTSAQFLTATNDTVVCYDDTLQLIANSNPNNSIIWSNGIEGPASIITEPGIYWVKSIGACGILRDTVFVSLSNDCGNITKIPSNFSANAQLIKNFQVFHKWVPELPEGSKLSIIDLSGKIICKNFKKEQFAAIDLDSGIYFYIFEKNGDVIQNGRVVLVK